MDELLEKFKELMEVIKTLRGPEGCPWDKEQTPFSMRGEILEEAYEVVEAISDAEKKPDKKNFAHAQEELGDLLLNVIMVSYMFEQAGHFSVASVCGELSKKLIRRHPHVFGRTDGYAGPKNTAKTKTPNEVLQQWDEIKETVEKRNGNSILDSIPKNFPAILRANKMQNKMSKFSFDFETISEVQKKLKEEITELNKEIQNAGLQNEKVKSTKCKKLNKTEKAKIESELGDVFFSAVNLARSLGLNPEVAISTANSKFENRVKFVEQKMKEKKLHMNAQNKDIMNEFWEEAKH